MTGHRKRATTKTAPRPRSPQPKQLDAGIFQAEISSFALRLAADGKAAKTIRTYTEAVQWFAASRLPGQASWEQVDSRDIQQWMAWLLSRYSNAYASRISPLCARVARPRRLGPRSSGSCRQSCGCTGWSPPAPSCAGTAAWSPFK